MIAIAYPEPQFKIKFHDEKQYLFDAIRKAWLLLTPEEWIRQNFVSYLITVMKYPVTLIALEKEIYLGDMKKRFDILVYNKKYQPWMLVECKAAEVPLNENVIHQVLRYNISAPVSFLIITNGNHTYGWEKKNNELQVITELPSATLL